MNVEPRAYFLELAGEVAALREVEATLRWDVGGEGGGTFYLNFAAGRLSGAETASRAPFLALAQERPDFERLVGAVGEQPLAPLTLLTGRSGARSATLERLSALDATLELRVTGETGFALAVHFAPEPRAVEPDTRLRLDAETFEALRAGRLEPQAAFLSGRIALEGDVGLAMRIALATLGGS